MFEQTPSEIPSSSIWAYMNSWFTPTVFFVLLNVMIGTIAFTSTLANKKQNQPTNQNQRRNEEIRDQPKPSVLQRLKSTNFYSFHRSQFPQNLSVYKQTPDSFNPEQSHDNLELQSHYFFQENIQVSQSQVTNYIFEQPHELNHQESQTYFAFEQKDLDLGDSKQTHIDFQQKDLDLDGSKQTHFNFEQKDPGLDGSKQTHFNFDQKDPGLDASKQTHLGFEQKHSNLDVFEQAQEDKIEENEAVEHSMDEVYSQLTDSHFIRTKSDTEPTSGKIPVKLSARMRKSASLKSPFGHFEEEKILEARRPATVRERRLNNAGAAEGDDEVDARADDFINKFKQQLKLQRLDSVIRYKDMIGRGSAGR